jgi:formylglycine-generating enzyme required for sulfatase activity/curved DNA-binding protein CbpA
MQDNLDYYRILGVTRDASASDIRRAFRALAKELHPDSKIGTDTSAYDFQLVTEAYETLKDEARRRVYDDELNTSRRLASLKEAGRPKRAFAVGLAVGLAIALVCLFGVSYLQRYLSRPVKSQESLASRTSAQTDTARSTIPGHDNEASLPGAGEPSSGRPMEGDTAEPKGEELFSLPKAKAVAATEQGSPSAALSPAGAAPASRPSPASFQEVGRQGLGNAPQQSELPAAAAAVPVREPQRGLTASVLSLENAAKGDPSAVSAHRLITLINTSLDIKELQEAAAAARSPQTRQLIESRLASLKTERTVAASTAKQDNADAVAVATGPSGAEKIVSIKPGSGLSEGFSDCHGCPEMVVVPAGQVVIGSRAETWSYRADEGGPRRVIIKFAFAVSKFGVSTENWRPCVEAGVCRPAPFLVASRPAFPATRVSWFDARGYVQWLSQVTGRRYRLLSEAEWDYLRLSGAGRPRDAPGLTGGPWPPAAGQFPSRPGFGKVTDTAPNSWGVHPMPAGLMEWVEDCWHPSVSQGPSDGSAWLSSSNGDCSYRVVRSANGAAIDGFERRPLTRAREFADARTVEIGFRVARDVAGPTVTAFDGK